MQSMPRCAEGWVGGWRGSLCPGLWSRMPPFARQRVVAAAVSRHAACISARSPADRVGAAICVSRVFGWLQEISLHEKKINTIHLEPGSEQLLVTSVGNGTVALWDARKLAKGAQPVAAGGHSYSCQAAYFAPDGDTFCASQNRMRTGNADSESLPPACVQPVSPLQKFLVLPMHRQNVFSSRVPCRRRMLPRM